MKKVFPLFCVLACYIVCYAIPAAAADGSGRQQQMSKQNTSPSAASSPAMRGYTGGVPQVSAIYPNPRTPSAPSGNGLTSGAAMSMPVLNPAPQSAPLAAPPAWAQTAYKGPAAQYLQPFGADLFQGNFSATYHDGLQAQYVIMPGDRIMVRIWGAMTYDDVLVVDQQGNIFIPDVGPVMVGGLTNAALGSAVKQQIASVFTENVESYTNLLNTQPVAVFVTGNVIKPGRYAGSPGDSIMYYLDRAGGIVPERGSYRHISVKRGKKTLCRMDLYTFLTQGTLPDLRLEDGDVILVENKGDSIGALGLLRRPARYEFDPGRITGSQLLAVSQPLPGASHVSVSGTRDKAAFNTYLSLEEFRNFVLNDEDIVEFHADKPGDTLMVGAAGAIEGASRFPVLKGTKLKHLLAYLEVDPRIADTDAVYLRRHSVAEQQKKALTDALNRLEQTSLTAPSSSVDEANIRVREAELVQDFVKRASTIEPDGVVVLSRKGQLNDLILEEGDIVYVPQRSDVVQVSGEVMIPKTVVYAKGLSLTDYIKGAGGYTERADKRNVLVVKPNGEVGTVASLGVGPGDQLLVMPEYDTKGVQMLKDIVQIMYQVAVSAGVVLVPMWK